MKNQKIKILIGLTFLVFSIVGVFWIINSHKIFNNAIENDLPTESLRPIYLYDIVILLFFGLTGLIGLIFVIWKIYKLKTHYNNGNRCTSQ
mgnify:CR=1 FL=1|tara:strand:- start:14 stop:286 length:273 start_codon:yes stop_codon:yes gene_type:complete